MVHLSEKICMKERNLAGKTIASVMCPDGTSTGGDDAFCDALDGSSAKFKDGSKGLDVTISYTFDLYRTILIHVFLIQVLQVVGLVTN